MCLGWCSGEESFLLYMFLIHNVVIYCLLYGRKIDEEYVVGLLLIK